VQSLLQGIACDIVPVNVKLMQQGVQTEPLCSLYLFEAETIARAFYDCPQRTQSMAEAG